MSTYKAKIYKSRKQQYRQRWKWIIGCNRVMVTLFVILLRKSHKTHVCWKVNWLLY